jgi:glycine/D-amino acid oxidase-like deaminating enzyme
VDGLAFGVDLAGLRASAAAVLAPVRVTSVDRVRKPGVERADRNVHAAVAVCCVGKGEWSVPPAVGASGVCGSEHNICVGARVR